TGANGFIGSILVKRLLSVPSPLPLTRLTVVDHAFKHLPEHPLINQVQCSCADPTALDTALNEPADCVVHLAAVPSGLCESKPDLGMEVNVQGVIRLLDKLKSQPNTPRLVFSSSIAIYGKPQGDEVNDDTGPRPTLT